MLRKTFLLLLFLAFCGMIFTLAQGDQGFSLLGLAGQAHPSQKPLPQAWSGELRAQVRPAGQPTEAAGVPTSGEAAPAPSGPCPASLTVQKGDTMGQIAKRCAVRLTDLLAANPEISNPNRIYPGQVLAIYGGRGGADPQTVYSEPVSAGFYPGGSVVVDAEGFPANAQVNVGIGLPGAGFKRLGVYQADAGGRLTAQVILPAAARSGERAFFLLSTGGTPTMQVISEQFVIQ